MINVGTLLLIVVFGVLIWELMVVSAAVARHEQHTEFTHYHNKAIHGKRNWI